MITETLAQKALRIAEKLPFLQNPSDPFVWHFNNEELTIFATRLAAELQAEHEEKHVEDLSIADEIGYQRGLEHGRKYFARKLEEHELQIAELTQEKDAIIASQRIEIESMETVAMQNVELRRKIATMQGEQVPVAYINIMERKLEFAKPTKWETGITVQYDKLPLYLHPTPIPEGYVLDKLLATERERCERVCHEVQMSRKLGFLTDDYNQGRSDAAQECWKAIRGMKP